MSFTIEVKDAKRSVWITHRGVVDLTAMESGRAQALAVMAERGYNRLLVDARNVEREPTPSEHHRFATSHVLYTPPTVAIAVVIRPEEFARPRNFETLARSQSVQLKAFTDLAEAQAWLEEVAV